jgi:hypothetical protein
MSRSAREVVTMVKLGISGNHAPDIERSTYVTQDPIASGFSIRTTKRLEIGYLALSRLDRR